MLKGTMDIQGLVAVAPVPGQQALYLAWACVSLENNRQLTDTPRYEGAGGHLFAVAARVSLITGFDGFMYGYAANARLARHYVEDLGADFVGVLHPYHVAFGEDASRRLLEVYEFEWRKNVYSAYRESLRKTGRAVFPDDPPTVTVAHQDLYAYANERGVPVSGLSREEVAGFVHEVSRTRGAIA